MVDILREELGTAGGYEKLTPASAATYITASVRKPESGVFKGMEAKAAYITVETAAIRFRTTGTATADIGHLIAANGNYTVKGRENVKNFNCYDDTGTASAVHVTVYF